MKPPAGSPRAILRAALTENVGLKIVALAASIGLFVIVRGTEDAQISIAVDVVALLPPPSTDRMLVSEIPDEVRVTLRGSRSVLNAVRRDGMQPLQMDLRDASAHFFYFEQEELELPAGASIVQIAPAAVPLRWVDRDEGRLPVHPLTMNEPAVGHEVVSRAVAPETVMVRGAASEVNRLDEVRTEPVDLAGLTAGTHRRRVPLMPLPDHVSYVDTVSVVVTLVVEEQEGRRSYDDLEVAVIGGGVGVTLRPAHVSVRVAGPRRRLEDLHPRRVIPYVDLTELDQSRGGQAVPVRTRPLPDGMTATVEPSEVIVVPQR